MSIYAGRGLTYETNQTHFLTKRFLWSEYPSVATHTISMGWVPANSQVIRCQRVVKTVTSSAVSCDVGFRNSVEGHTTDDDAFSETIFALGTALGVVHGTVAANALFFSAPAEIFMTAIVGTTLTAGEAYLSVEFINYNNSEAL